MSCPKRVAGFGGVFFRERKWVGFFGASFCRGESAGEFGAEELEKLPARFLCSRAASSLVFPPGPRIFHSDSELNSGLNPSRRRA